MGTAPVFSEARLSRREWIARALELRPDSLKDLYRLGVFEAPARGDPCRSQTGLFILVKFSLTSTMPCALFRFKLEKEPPAAALELSPRSRPRKPHPEPSPRLAMGTGPPQKVRGSLRLNTPRRNQDAHSPDRPPPASSRCPPTYKCPHRGYDSTFARNRRRPRCRDSRCREKASWANRSSASRLTTAWAAAHSAS